MRNSRKWFYCVILAATILGAGCHRDRYQVIKEQALDYVPALVRVEDPTLGYEPSDVALALIPIMPNHKTQARIAAKVVAIYRDNGRKWDALSSNQSRSLRAETYKYATIKGMEAQGKKLPEVLNERITVRDEANFAVWLRIAHSGPRINLEVAFDTQPMTIRKVVYVPADNGEEFDLLGGTLLQVRKN